MPRPSFRRLIGVSSSIRGANASDGDIRIVSGNPARSTFGHILGYFGRMEVAQNGPQQSGSHVKFCQECRQLLREISSLDPKCDQVSRLHHTSYLAYAEAVASGCSICTQLELQDARRSDWPLQCTFGKIWHGTEDSIEHRLSTPFELDFLILVDSIYISKSFYILPALSVSDSVSRPIYSPANNTGSKECLTLARQWLKTCVDGHETCNHARPASLEDWNPTRLIFVGTHDDPALRLCEGSAIHPRVDYLTLSHCWGTNLERKVLEQHKLASWFREIPCHEIMNTFKDAIDVTRTLGLQYLWIDSLCIIQDSPKDWLDESSLMSKVYQFSYCTIAAAHASSDAIGVFVDRKTPKCPPGRFKIDDGNGEGFEGPYKQLDYEKAWQDLRESPLYRRAWVVQERILSPRLLHFARHQLFWECNELRTCELFPGEMPRSMWHHSGLQDHKIFDFRRQSFREMLPSKTLLSLEPQLLYIWFAIVGTYTGCQLTKEADKLIAISAIAKAMKPMIGCRYLAGLWEKDLVRQLGWFLRPSGQRPRPTTYRAPSWSWASVEGTLDHFKGDTNTLIEIRSAQVDLASDDEMGPVEGGHLDMTGQLFVVDSISRMSELETYLNVHSPEFSVSFEYWEDSPLTEINGPLHLLPLTVHADFERASFKALVLQQSENPACYQRVGCVRRYFDVPAQLDASGNYASFFKALGEFTEIGGENPDNGFSFSRNNSRMQELRLV